MSLNDDTAAPGCSLQLFGAPNLICSGHVVTLKRRQARAILFYLGAQGDSSVPRDTLLGLLWPEKERAVAQQTLRTLLHGLRRDLNGQLIEEGHALRLSSDVAVDVRTFEAGLAAGPESLAAALQLYRGDFLSGFTLDGAPSFEEWILVERERYRRLAVRGLTRLSAQQSAAGRYAEALASIDRALALDPLQEDVQRDALRLHMLAGDRPGAIRRYDDLRRLLDDELGVTPMAETRALYDAIINDRETQPAAAAPPTAPTPAPDLPVAPIDLPFVGREPELDAMAAAVGRATLVLIEGEPGIGKTRLALRFAEVQGLRPWLGAAYELETGVPYAPIIDAIRAGLATIPGPGDRLPGLAPVWRQEAARLLPELAGPEFAYPGSTSPDEARVREALFRVATTLTRATPGLIVLDDLHWADTSTLAFVAYLVRRAAAERLPLTVVATARPHAVGSALAQMARGLSREGRLVSIQPGRLGVDAIDAFAHQLSRDFGVPLGQWLARQSEGNPYILTELVRDLRRTQRLRPDGAVNLSALDESPALTQSVSSLILSRLTLLSDGARRVLDAAVAAGREFEAEVVWRAAGLSEVAGLDALDELRRSGLVLSVSGRDLASAVEIFRFDHTLTMEAAYRDIGEARHRMMHRRVAEALEHINSDPENSAAQLAWHFREGGDFERAAPYAFEAGQRAARLAAWHEAIEQFEHALEGTRQPAEQVSILAALAQAQLNSGQAALAGESFRRAIHIEKDPERLTDLRLELCQAYFALAHFGEALALAAYLATQGDAAVTPLQQARAELQWGTILSAEGADLKAAGEHLEHALALMANCPTSNPALMAQAQFELGSLAAQQGDLATALAYYEHTLAIAHEDGNLPMWEALALNNLAYHLLLLGDPTRLPEAEARVRQGLRLAEDRGLLNLLPYLYSTRGELQLAAGDVDGAQESFLAGLAQAEAIGHQERIAGLNANLGLVARARGEHSTAIHRLSTALAKAEAVGTQHLAAQIRIWLAPLLPPDEARLRLAEARVIAEAGGRKRLLEQIEAIE